LRELVVRCATHWVPPLAHICTHPFVFSIELIAVIDNSDSIPHSDSVATVIQTRMFRRSKPHGLDAESTGSRGTVLATWSGVRQILIRGINLNRIIQAGPASAAEGHPSQ
jgi:hypothetical protein